ncbi:MAG: hypothetical protein EOM22_11475 [Gammaproteobacteria bacterium]|nr:hypothetical protein [Gammaproteobacteria bacterium]
MMTDTAGAAQVDPYNVWLGLDVIEDRIPVSLKVIDQWVAWKAEPKLDKGVGKVPYRENGRKASSTDPRTWMDYPSAIGIINDEDSGYAGVGFVLRSENGILALDFDHVRDAHTGAIREDVMGAIMHLGTYAEISPSGTGVRIIGYGTMDRAITSVTLQGWVTGRFITITGHRLDGVAPDLRPIDPERLAEVAAWFSDKPKPAAASVSVAPSGYMLDVRQVLEIRSALGFVDPDESYDIWIQIGMALRSTGADNAFGLWNEWSQIGPKYQAAVMRLKWGSFTDKPNGVALPTLFKLAQDRGWVNPATREAQAFEAATGLSYEEANRRAPEPVIKQGVSPTWRAFPVHGLDEVAAWIDATGSVTYRSVTQHAVLSLIGLAASRLYVTPQGDPLSLYLGCCGRSVGELRYAHHAVSSALSAAGLRRLVRSTRMSSPQAIYKTLLRAPAALYISDDYGGVAAFSKRQPSGLQEHALSLIASIYDGKAIQLDGPEDAGFRPGSGQVSDEQPVIYAPCLSVLALIGNDQLSTLMRQSETGRGALQQMLYAIGEERDALEKDPQDTPPPPWLAETLRRMRRVPNADQGTDINLADIFGNTAAGVVPSPVVVAFGADVQPIYAELDALSDDRRTRSLILAARGFVRRISAALAAWANPDAPVVSPEILDWSGSYVVDRMRETVERFDVMHSTDGKVSPYSQVLEKLIESGPDGIPEGRLQAASWLFRNLSAKLRAELIEQMIGDQVVVEVSTKPAGRGRPAKRLVSTKFIKSEAAQ